MSFWTSIAFAQEAQPAVQPGASGIFAQLLPLFFIIIIFYFLLIRPQQQRQKSQRELWDSLKKGDQVVTVGGMHGTVVQVKDAEVVLEVAKDVRITFSKSAIESKK
ncbi:MAG: preprotein translocase subunit YajC [Candidatus Atribacteria bacterium]|nr:preprotein translocase subunit YajC [Candidatus Atribacteria bacterium]MCD6349591.1 preprotein translocase subunit YajC [Candidatus Atribacteria bacterium]